nr:hypothetical protein [Tanacetum cinerariifolium]
SPRNQESMPRNQDSSKNTMNVEDTSSKAMVAIDGAGFDWIYMVDDEVPTNMALMTFLDSEFDLGTYKRGLAYIEEKLVFYKKNKVMFCDQIALLKRDASFRDSEITSLKLQIKTLKKEKESNQIKIDNFKNASKSLDKLIGSQIYDNSRTGLGFTSYNVVVHSPTGLFAPPTVDLSNSNLEEFQHPEFEGYGPKASKSVCVVLTKSGIVPISTARQSSSRAAAPVSAARPINTDVPKPLGNKVTSIVGKQGINVVKSSACWVWRPKIKEIYPTSLTSKSMMDDMLPLGEELKVAEAVNTACYVKNRVLVVKPHFKTPYELFKGRSPALSFMRPFGCHVTILNTLDQLGKFVGKSDEGIFVAYSTISGGPEWLFDIDALSESISYAPVPACINSNDFAVNTATLTYIDYPSDPLMPNLEDTGIFNDVHDDRDEGAETDYINLKRVISVSPIPSTRVHKDHPKEQIIGEVHSAVQTRKTATQNEAGLLTFINKQRRTNHKDFQNCLFACFLTQMEPKKRDQRGIVVRNKASLVAQGHRQEEGIDYDEVFALVTRIEAIRLFLAYASYTDFTVYQMDVKSTFLYGTIEEEVYVSQTPGFVDPEFPDRVYKVEKALYGLHQAPRAWYETLSTYLLENGFKRETIDKTLFIKKIKNDIILVQVYVDDIIFGSTNRSLSTEFEQLMHKRLQMSSMGELTFFLGLQVEQQKDGIFLSQDKYVCDILKKFSFSSVKSASTPMETHKLLSKDANVIDVDAHLYSEANL